MKWSELRVFLTSNGFAKEPTQLNNMSAPDNVEKLKDLTGIGLEADARVKPWLKVGTRIKGIWNAANQPNPPSPAVAYVQVQQYSAGIVGRVPVVEKDGANLDVFAEIGLANTSIDVQTVSSGKGSWTNNAGPYGRAGVSVGLGWPTFKFFFEAGQEWNNLDKLSYTGTMTNNLSSVDFSGLYSAVGVIIYGIPSWIKPGGITVGK